MRRRVVRDLTALAGVAAVLAAVTLINMNWGRSDLIERYDTLRRKAEKERTDRGLELMPWQLIRQTKGNIMSGPTYPDDIRQWDGKKVDVVGFNVALNQYRNMSEFMLLPLPLECYFCQIPPMKDQILVTMAEGKLCERLYKEPIVVNGTFRLQKGKDEKFFYYLENAGIGPGEPDLTIEQLTPRIIPQEHMQPQHENPGDLLPGTELFAPQAEDAATGE